VQKNDVLCLRQASTDEARQASANEPQRSVLDLLKTPRLRRNTILLTLLW
jgi:hypothetical protein